MSKARSTVWKVRPIVDVTDPAFGAKGDGSTDDSSAFEAANDALPTIGGTIYLPQPKTSYKLGTVVSITKRAKWVGQGKLAAPIVCGAANSAFSATFTGGYLEFENLFIQGDSSTGTTGTAFNIVGTSSANKLTFLKITNCYIKDFSAPFIFKYIDNALIEDTFYFQSVSGVTTAAVATVTFCQGVMFRKFMVAGSGATLPVRAITFGSDTDTCTVQNCTLYRTGGILFNNIETGATFPPRYCQVANTAIEPGEGVSEDNDTCIRVLACQDLSIRGCRLLAGYHGIYISGGEHIEIDGGSVYANQRHGIFVTNAAEEIHIKGVKVYDNSQAADNTYRGILFSGACVNFSIIGCSVRSNIQASSGNKHQYHLSIGNNSANFVVANNRFNDAGTNVYNFGTGFTAYSIRGNQVRDASSTGTLTLANASTTTVANKNVHPYARVHLTPSNSAAAALAVNAAGIYVDNKVTETSFRLNHAAAAGTETFDYTID